jgi:hypothetical protein
MKDLVPCIDVGVTSDPFVDDGVGIVAGVGFLPRLDVGTFAHTARGSHVAFMTPLGGVTLGGTAAAVDLRLKEVE